MGTFQTLIAICAAAAAAVTSLGFVRPIHFITLGYGGAVAAQAVATLAFQPLLLDLPAIVHNGIMLAYGVRLTTFILWRNTLPSFQERRERIEQRSGGLSLLAKAGMWVICSAMYVAMFLPTVYNSLGRPPGMHTAALSHAGLVLCALGLVWEATADVQQQLHYEAQEGGQRKLPCMRGLFRLSRHANYFGELAIWLGSFLAGSRAYASFAEWTLAAVGAVGIIAVVAGESKRRGHAQVECYSGSAAWEEYARKTPQLVPIVGKRLRRAGAGEEAQLKRE